MQCATHPAVETELRCGRCETPICPRCLVQSPVGSRCRACSRIGRPKMYEISAGAVARTLPVALVLGVVAGTGIGLAFPFGLIGFFDIFIAILVGGPVGYFYADVLDRVSKRRRGPVMQGIAIGGVVAMVLASFAAGGSPANILLLALAAVIGVTVMRQLR